jgi:hypothetical protein
MALRIPTTPAPPLNLVAPYGSAAPFNPQWTSFLPADPNAVATGLTPQMLAGIQAGPQFTPTMPVPQAQAQQQPQQQNRQRDLLAQLLANPATRKDMGGYFTGGPRARGAMRNSGGR